MLELSSILNLLWKSYKLKQFNFSKSMSLREHVPYILIRRNWGHISNNIRLQKANRIHTCENDFPEFAVLTYQLSTFSRTWYAPSLCTLQLTDNRDCVSTSKNL